MTHLVEIAFRCNKCLTKLWCSKECRDQDWELAHKLNCTEEANQRKVKAGKKEWVDAGVERQRYMFEVTSRMETVKNQAFLKEVRAACTEGNN